MLKTCKMLNFKCGTWYNIKSEYCDFHAPDLDNEDIDMTPYIEAERFTNYWRNFPIDDED